MHVNVYGPPASGKTRFAQQFKKHYNCGHVFDQGMQFDADSLKRASATDPAQRVLILTQQPVRRLGVQNVSILAALQAIGKVV